MNFYLRKAGIYNAREVEKTYRSKQEKLISRQKQIELEQYKILLLATLDYFQERWGGSIVMDGFDPATLSYQQQKEQTEKYFRECRLDRMKQKFKGLTRELQMRADLVFSAYLRERTGYDIDLFEDLLKTVHAIVEQNEIRTRSEALDVGIMLHFYSATATEGSDVEKLKFLLSEYYKPENGTNPKRQRGNSEVVSRVQEDGVSLVREIYWTGPRPRHYEEKWVSSPDGKRKILIHNWRDDQQSYTYVSVHFPAATGTIYAAKGIHPDIKAWWKDNATIVIETKHEISIDQSREVRSFDDVITIEYIER